MDGDVDDRDGVDARVPMVADDSGHSGRCEGVQRVAEATTNSVVYVRWLEMDEDGRRRGWGGAEDRVQDATAPWRRSDDGEGRFGMRASRRPRRWRREAMGLTRTAMARTEGFGRRRRRQWRRLGFSTVVRLGVPLPRVFGDLNSPGRCA